MPCINFSYLPKSISNNTILIFFFWFCIISRFLWLDCVFLELYLLSFNVTGSHTQANTNSWIVPMRAWAGSAASAVSLHWRLCPTSCLHGILETEEGTWLSKGWQSDWTHSPNYFVFRAATPGSEFAGILLTKLSRATLCRKDCLACLGEKSQWVADRVELETLTTSF